MSPPVGTPPAAAQPTGNAADLIGDLGDLGADARFVACDVGDQAALAAALATIPADRPLTAVVHLAGVLDDGVIGSLTPERVATVLRPSLTPPCTCTS
ncbi:KR domain-containing protein [Micromonospora sp. M12]